MEYINVTRINSIDSDFDALNAKLAEIYEIKNGLFEGDICIWLTFIMAKYELSQNDVAILYANSTLSNNYYSTIAKYIANIDSRYIYKDLYYITEYSLLLIVEAGLSGDTPYNAFSDSNVSSLTNIILDKVTDKKENYIDTFIWAYLDSDYTAIWKVLRDAQKRKAYYTSNHSNLTSIAQEIKTEYIDTYNDYGSDDDYDDSEDDDD